MAEIQGSITALLVGVLVVGTVPRAAAQADNRVVLVDPDGSLRDAVDAALRPWGMTVVPVDSDSPGATMPGSADRGAQLAETHDATAAIWVSVSEAGHALWIYDRRHGRAVARQLPSGPPFDATTAVEVALIVKTLLRQGAVSPPPTAVPSPEPAPPVDSSSDEPARSRSPRVREWSLMTSIGARFAATAPDRAEGRLGLWLSFWPAVLEAHLGFGLMAASGPGLGVVTDELSAHWTDTAVVLVVRGRLPLGEVLDIGATFGAGGQFTTLVGTLTATGQAASVQRLNPLLHGDIDIGLRVDRRLRIEGRVGSTFPLRPQTYLVGDAPGLEIQPANLRVFLSAEIELF